MNEFANPGCVLFLIDESEAMDEVIAGGTRRKSEVVATALNSLFNQVSSGPDFLASVIGYRTDAAGQPVVQCRWGGARREDFCASERAAGIRNGD